MSLKVVVVGAGVMGAAMAAELARHGCSVTVLDSGAPASGTSGATFSWTNSNNKTPRSYHDLNVEGLRAHRRLAQEAASCDWYHERGNLEWKADPAARENQRRKAERLTDWGYPVRWLEPSQARELEPDLAAGKIDGPVAYYPEEGWVDPVPLVRALLSSARAAGAEVRPHSAVVGMPMAATASPASPRPTGRPCGRTRSSTARVPGRPRSPRWPGSSCPCATPPASSPTPPRRPCPWAG